MVRSVVRHIVRAYGAHDAKQVPLTLNREMPERLRQYLRERHPPLKATSVRTFVYYLRRLLRWGIEQRLIGSEEDDVEKAWPAYEGIAQRKDRVAYSHLAAYRRFRRWAIARGLRPIDVRPCHLAEWLENDVKTDRPSDWRMVYRRLKRFWGEKAARGHLPPVAIPDLPTNRPSEYGLRLDTWPEHLRDRYWEYHRWSTAEIQPGRPRRLKQNERTAAHRRRLLELYVGYLQCEEHVRLEEIAFEDLFTEPWVTRYIQWLVARSRDGRLNGGHMHFLTAIKTLVEGFLKHPPESCRWIRDLRSQISETPPTESLSDLPGYDALLSVPESIRRARLQAQSNYRGRPTLSQRRWQAMEVGKELLFRFLLARPLRSRNVRGLRWDHSLVKRDGTWWVDIPGEDVKNGERLCFEFPPDLVPLLEDFRDNHWPLLSAKTGTDLVFPTRTGRQMSAASLLTFVKRVCKQYAGQDMTVHRFRHVAATHMLRERPGAYPLVSALLGHRSIRTALETYGHLDIAAAARRFDAWRTERTSGADPDARPDDDGATERRLLQRKRRPKRRRTDAEEAGR